MPSIPLKKSRFASLRERLGDSISGYLFILPALLPFLLFIVIPIIQCMYNSLFAFRIEYGRGVVTFWVGLDNFKALLTDELFYQGLWNLFRYTIVVVPLGILNALILALLVRPLNAKVRVFFRAAFYLPAVISGVIMGLVWLWFFNPVEGLLNYLVGLVGIPPQRWLADIHLALYCLMFMAVVQANGGGMIMYMAAMDAIPGSLYDAALMDRASPFTILRRVTLPLLKPITLFLLIIGIISSFQLFTQIWVMTAGGPRDATTTLAYQIVVKAFKYREFGMASAEALILGGIIFVVAVMQYRFFSGEIEY